MCFRFSAVLLALCVMLAAAPAPAAGQPIRLDPGVTVDTLANGLTYYIRPNDEPAGRAELRLVVDAGSVLEDDDQRGLAHVVEHMAFNGTEHFARQELVDYLERIGMRFGPEINASTGFDETIYRLTVPTDSAGYLATAFRILEDWASGIRFEPEEVERERGVVIEEWRLRRDADLRMTERELAVQLAGSPYPERLPIGTLESLQSFTREALVRFYERWYRPDLMTVVAVGDFDPAEVDRLVRAHFAHLEVPAAAPPRPRPAVPLPDAPRLAVLTDPEAAGASVIVQYQHAPAPVETEADFRREVVESLYFGILSRRLAERMREPDAPFHYAYAYGGRIVRPVEAHAFRAGVDETRLLEGTEALLTEVERAARHGFTEAELARQKADVLHLVERAYRERANTTSGTFADAYVQHALYGTPTPGAERSLELYRALLPAIGEEEVRAVAAEVAEGGSPVVLVRTPPGADPPAEAALYAAFDRVRSRPIEPYAEAAVDGPLVADLPAPGRIVDEERDSTLGTIAWTLSNGARVLLKPTSFREDEVLFAAQSPGGLSLAADSAYAAAVTAASVVQETGVGAFGKEALRKRLAGEGVSLVPWVDDLSEGLSGAASADDVETLLRLAYLHMTAPRADTGAFLAYRDRMIGLYEHRGSRPESVFADTIRVTMAQHHPRARPRSAAFFSEMDLDASLAFYRERFRGAGDFTFFFVGAFDPDSLRPLVERYLASLPPAERAERPRDRGIRPPSGVVRRVVRMGREPKSRTHIAFTGPFTWDRTRRLELRVLADVLELRLRASLREALGGTYGVLVSASPARDPVPAYELSISFGSDPERLAELSAAVFAHVDTLKTQGADPADLAKVKASYLRSYETSRETNRYWLRLLQFYDRYGGHSDDPDAFSERLARLSPADVQAAARRYLDTENYVQVSLLPEDFTGPVPAPPR